MQEAIFSRIRQEIGENDVVLYMKGSAAFPQCGFSAAMVEVLKSLNIPFRDVDVLLDADLHQAVKNFANWPAIPQLYIKGEFIGGCDAVREIHATGELRTLLADKGLLKG